METGKTTALQPQWPRIGKLSDKSNNDTDEQRATLTSSPGREFGGASMLTLLV